MTDPRQTAIRDNFGAPLCTCPHADANEPYEMHDRACVVRAVKRPREVCDFTVGVPARTHQDDYTKFLHDHDPGAPDDFTGHVLAPDSGFAHLTLAESGQEMQIHMDACSWSDKTPDDIIADLQTLAVAPPSVAYHDYRDDPVVLVPARRWMRWLKQAKRRARMARKRRRGWA